MKDKKLPKITDFKLLYDNVLVRALVVREKRGVIVAIGSDNKPEIGEVVSIGSGRLLDNGESIPLNVKVKDIVYFNKYLSTKFNFDGEDFYVLREEDIVAYKR